MAPGSDLLNSDNPVRLDDQSVIEVINARTDVARDQIERLADPGTRA